MSLSLALLAYLTLTTYFLDRLDLRYLFGRHAVAKELAPLRSWQPLFEDSFMCSALVALKTLMASQKAVLKHATVLVQQPLSIT